MDLLPQQLKKIFKKSKALFVHVFVVLKKKKPSIITVDQTDKKLVYSLASSKIPRREQLKHIFKLLNPREKLLFKLAVLFFIISAVYLIFNFYQNNLISLPRSGGTYREGTAAYPQNINPLYSANRDIDSDISRLVYSSLFNYDVKGHLQEDLVDSWQVSTDGKEYSLHLKENVKWHNGNILNADDVVFTVNLIKNPAFKSSLRSTLNGVNIEKVDDYTVRFILVEPYADFLHLLIFGIMPRFAWENSSPETVIISELNLQPIGSGPYEFASLVKSKGGELKEYQLTVNPDYYGVKPYIENIVFKFYPSSNEVVRALNANEIEGASYVPNDLKGDLLAKHSLNFYSLQLPQINSIFFNQNKNSYLKDIKVRQALAWSIDRNRLFQDVLNQEVKMADGPILAPEFISTSTNSFYLDVEKASSLLSEAGFKKLSSTDSNFADEVELSEEMAAIKKYAQDKNLSLTGLWWLDKDNNVLNFKLSYPESINENIILSLQQDWQNLGINISLDKISSADLSGRIKSYDFEILLYGQLLGLDPDIAAFWHSTQIGEQGLNLAQYKNTEVDTLLTEARKITVFEERFLKYQTIQEKIITDLPVIFLYSPSYTYIQAKKLKGFEAYIINVPSDRFAGISNWYLRTKKRFNW